MKKIIKNLMLVAVAAMGFVACQDGVDEVVVKPQDTVSVEFTASFDETRSQFGEKVENSGYPSSWSGGEQIMLSLNETTPVIAQVESEGATANFTATLTSDGNTEGSIFAFSPAGTYENGVSTPGFTGISADYDSAYVYIPSEQSPIANSCDENVHLLAAECAYTDGIPASANLSFAPVAAFGKMTITDFEGTIANVTLESSEPLAGNAYYYYAGEKVGTLVKRDSGYVNTLTLDATNVQNNVFWFGCIPAVLDNTTLTVVVTDTEEKTYTKKIDLTDKKLAFKQGRVANFAVSFKDIAVDEVVDPSTFAYQLVTDASQLSVGKYVIIAASDYDVAMSTDQKSNNRGQATITKYDDIAEVSETVQYILLEEGAVANTYAFNVGNGYLYAASSGSNHLKTQTTNDGNSSWKIEISGGPNYSASIVAQGSNTRNVMQYNQSSSLFSCYGSESQKALALYVGVDPSTIVKKTALETPVLNATLEGKIITLSWDYITNAKDYTVTFGNNEPMTVVGTTTTFDGEWNTSYEITVVANPVDDTKYIQSSATISVVIGSDPSSSDKVDILNRALTGVTGTSYTEWSDKTVSSKAVYAGQSAGGNESIQLRATSPSGIVTTASGGKATKVVVSWNSNTADGRTLDVYGKNTAYSKTTDLYSTSTQGTKIGSIVCGTSTELIIDGVYQYIGMRSNDGAMYIDKIQITWAEMTADDVVPAEPLAKPSDLKAEVTENTIKVSWAAVTGATGYKVSINDAANTTATIEGTSYIFTGLTADTEYTISVVALGNGETTTDSEVATIDAVPTAQDVSGDTTKTYTFSEYTAGTQYADNEEHELDEVLTITTTDCHFTSELRIYSSSTYNGYAIGKLAKGTIKKLGFNAGNKSDTLNVYGSTDGSTWTLVKGVSVTSAYADYTVDFGNTNYTYFKLDVAGTNQIRVKSLTLTYAK